MFRKHQAIFRRRSRSYSTASNLDDEQDGRTDIADGKPPHPGVSRRSPPWHRLLDREMTMNDVFRVHIEKTSLTNHPPTRHQPEPVGEPRDEIQILLHQNERHMQTFVLRDEAFADAIDHRRLKALADLI